MLTENRRLPLRRRFSHNEIWQRTDLRDGADVAAEIYRLKMGDARDRDQFALIQAMFKDLVGRSLEVRAYGLPLGDEGSGLIIEPVVTNNRGDRPVAFSGAGIQEALVLSVLLADRAGKTLVLDEPAVNLEPTAQRRLLRHLRSSGQCIVITHHPDLVPAGEPADLNRIVRVAPSPSGATILRPDLGDAAARDAQRWLRFLESAHVRGLLFAPAVILCEGITEARALPLWWHDTSRIGLRDPERSNIPILRVDGHKSFGAYIRYLSAFGIPWAIVADGPALHPGSDLATQMREMGLLPDRTEEDPEDFGHWQKTWEGVGVFTLADQFGIDGSKGGEFEAFLLATDPDLLQRVQIEAGRSKPVAAALFVAEYPDPPGAVFDLYKKIAQRLGTEAIPPDN